MQTNSRKWSYSSAGSEHLPYKQGVLGSNPSGTTETTSNEVVFFILGLGWQSWVAQEGTLKIEIPYFSSTTFLEILQKKDHFSQYLIIINLVQPSYSLSTSPAVL
ncbi:MAG: hypothetical protein RLZZ402_630 [Bacteroidota bacterium]